MYNPLFPHLNTLGTPSRLRSSPSFPSSVSTPFKISLGSTGPPAISEIHTHTHIGHLILKHSNRMNTGYILVFTGSFIWRNKRSCVVLALENIICLPYFTLHYLANVWHPSPPPQSILLRKSHEHEGDLYHDLTDKITSKPPSVVMSSSMFTPPQTISHIPLLPGTESGDNHTNLFHKVSFINIILRPTGSEKKSHWGFEQQHPTVTTQILLQPSRWNMSHKSSPSCSHEDEGQEQINNT